MENLQGKTLKIDNIWRNVYWFARTLINSDQFGGFGANSSKVVTLSSALRTIFDALPKVDDEQELLELLRFTLTETLEKISKEGTKLNRQNSDLAKSLNTKIFSVNDFKVLLFTCEQVMIPTNSLLDNVPNNDRDFTDTIVKAYLEKQGEKALSTV